MLSTSVHCLLRSHHPLSVQAPETKCFQISASSSAHGPCISRHSTPVRAPEARRFKILLSASVHCHPLQPTALSYLDVLLQSKLTKPEFKIILSCSIHCPFISHHSSSVRALEAFVLYTLFLSPTAISYVISHHSSSVQT